MNTSLYQINTRVWLRRFDRGKKRAQLADVPTTFWDTLSRKGIQMVWLMGAWQTVSSEVRNYDLAPHLVRGYDQHVPEWQEEDVIGSPYAIDRYVVNPDLGGAQALAQVRQVLHQRGMLLILDFVPNHFHAASTLIAEHPEFFMSAQAHQLQQDSASYYRAHHDASVILAHGKDPYFPAWHDTVQVNYFRADARQFMVDQLLQIAAHCDGLRCDMAMLLLNDIFQNTWRHLQPEARPPEEEFWQQAIAQLRDKYPDFSMIAEVYWDKEAALHQLGFDYTYDKTLLDLIKTGNIDGIHHRLQADPQQQQSAVRFLENHDEERILGVLNQKRAEAAAVMIATLPGLRLYHNGQWEGRRAKIPVQLGKEPQEQACQCAIPAKVPNKQLPDGPAHAIVCTCTFFFYERLLEITRDDIFRLGSWTKMDVHPLSDGAETHRYLLAWQWQWEEQERWVFINYHDGPAEGRVQVPWTSQTNLKECFLEQTVPEIKDGHVLLRFYPYQYWIISKKLSTN